jgi:hypothetical protein
MGSSNSEAKEGSVAWSVVEAGRGSSCWEGKSCCLIGSSDGRKRLNIS